MAGEDLMAIQLKRRIGSQAKRRIALWLALVVPLLAYVLVFPVKARLDAGETEQHFALEIWRTMGNELPAVDLQWLFKLAFFAGGIVVVLGVAILIWFALDETPANDSAQLVLTEPDYDPPGDGSSLNSLS